LFALLVVLLAAAAVALAFSIRSGSDSEPGRIAFWQEGQGDAANLFVMNADEAGRPRALLKGFDPTWSPDGKRIAFTLEESTFPEFTSGVWVCPVADPGRASRLASLAPVYGKHLAWSPDGEKIAFSGVVTAKRLPNYRHLCHSGWRRGGYGADANSRR
jgi:Tol biopolymer transport system component